MQTFTLFTFTTKGHQVKLVLPETWQAKELFEGLQKDKEKLAKWLKWANNINSIAAEANSIKNFQQKMIAGTNFNLTIFVDGYAKGMVDLHKITQESGEVGYWLSSDVQHLGIMTKSVNLLTEYAFTQLNLKFLLLRAKAKNFASQHVAERCHFQYLTIEDGFKVYQLKK